MDYHNIKMYWADLSRYFFGFFLFLIMLF